MKTYTIEPFTCQYMISGIKIRFFQDQDLVKVIYLRHDFEHEERSLVEGWKLQVNRKLI